MDEPLSVTYSLTTSLLGDFAIYDFWARSRVTFTLKAIFCLITLTVSGVIGGASLGQLQVTTSPLYPIAGGALGLVFAALILFVYVASVLRASVATGVRNGAVGKHTMTISPEGVLVRNPNSETKWNWRGVQRVVTTEQFVLIYPSELLCLVIPREAFESAAAAEQFTRAAKRWIAAEGVGRQ